MKYNVISLLIVLFYTYSLKASFSDTLLLLSNGSEKEWLTVYISINGVKYTDDSTTCFYEKTVLFKNNYKYDTDEPCNPGKNKINADYKVINSLLITENKDTSSIIKITSDTLKLYSKQIVYINNIPFKTIETYTTYKSISSAIINNKCNTGTNFTIFPNPITSHINIFSINDIQSCYEIQLLDIQGVIKYSKEICDNYCIINLEEIPSGIYLIVIKYKDFIEIKRIFKQ